MRFIRNVFINLVILVLLRLLIHTTAPGLWQSLYDLFGIFFFPLLIAAVVLPALLWRGRKNGEGI